MANILFVQLFETVEAVPLSSFTRGRGQVVKLVKVSHLGAFETLQCIDPLLHYIAILTLGVGGVQRALPLQLGADNLTAGRWRH